MLPGNSVSDLIEVMRRSGYKVTQARRAVVETLVGEAAHLTAPDLIDAVQKRAPGVGRASVYRTLELLKRLGLATETDLGEGRVRYHSAEKGQHHHLVCKECGAIIDLDEQVLLTLKETLLREYQFIADLKHLAFLGRCANCRK